MILRWDVVNRWRKMLNVTIVMIIALFCIENLTMPRPFEGVTDPFAVSMYDGCMISITIVCSFFLMYGSTTILNDMRTKQERITTLMLPGTNLEKFLSKLTKSLVIFFLLTVIAFLIADVARMIVATLFEHVSSDSLIPYAWSMFKQTPIVRVNGTELEQGYQLFTGWMLGASILTLFGVLFNRNPFAIAAVFTFIISTLFGMVLMNFDIDTLNEITKNISEMSQWLIGSIKLVVSLGLFYLSYRIFCHIQAINNKFINL